MASLSAIFGLNGLESKGAGQVVLDLVYGRSVILLQDFFKIFKIGVPIPVPIIGFVYQTPDEVELLNYRWSEYPFLNKQQQVCAYVKEPTKFSIKAIRPITRYNTIPINQALNEGITYALDYYVSKGGRFIVITPWSVIPNCFLEKAVGIKLTESDFGGQGWIFQFKNYGNTGATKKNLNSFLESITKGTV